MNIAQPATSFFEIGLEHERDFAGLRVPRVDARRELVEPPLRAVFPLRERGRAQLVAERRVAREVPRAEQRGRGVEVALAQVERLALRAHAVTELHACVPDRIPDTLGD